MTPQEIKQRAPNGATHFDFNGGQPVYYMRNHLGYTFKSYGGEWILSIGLNLNNFRAI